MTYEIGTKFIGQGKRKDVYTIIDRIEHFSIKENKVINITYIATHEFMGQLITSEHSATTLDRAKFDNRIIGD